MKSKMRVIRKPLDPMATRISAGGIKDVGNYIVYRGDLEDVQAILLECLTELSSLEKEPEIDFSELEHL